MTEQAHPPAWAVTRPRGDETPLPPGVDYRDELEPAIPPGVVGDDEISVAVGSPIFIERPGGSWVPWAVREGPLGTREPVIFTRYYPAVRLAVDIFPQRDNLAPDEQARIEGEMEFRLALCAGNGTGYVGVYLDDPVDEDAIAQAKRPPEAVGLSTTMEVQTEGQATTMPLGADLDPVSEAVGACVYIQNASQANLSWATRVPGPEMEWAAEPLVFSRYYYSVPILVDILPERNRLSPSEVARIEDDVRHKRRLCRKHGMPYLFVWGGAALSQTEVARAMRRAQAVARGDEE